MPTQNGERWEALVNRIIEDRGFRERLEKTPEKALAEMGIEATSDMVDALNQFDWKSMDAVLHAFRRARFPIT
jgi:hypothetical protein